MRLRIHRPSSRKCRKIRDAKRIMKNGSTVIVGQEFVEEEETHFTVRKTSLFFAGDGFTAYDCKGDLVYRVDSYGPDAGESNEVILMDAKGKCILTVRRKRPSLHQRWEGFIGEKTDGQKPVFSVRRSSMIGRSSLTVEVYTTDHEGEDEEYQIEGSFFCRNCTIFNSDKEVVAEIRRKVDTSTNMVLGKDVFLLSLKAGFDSAFAMGLVLVLDRILGDVDDNYLSVGDHFNNVNGSRVGVDPS